MPQAIGNGENPGDNVGANKNDGQTETGQSANPADNPNASNTGQDGQTETAVTFKSQKDVDAMVQRRIDRALKAQKDEAELSENDRLKKQADDARRELQIRDLRDDLVAELGIDAKRGRSLFAAYRDELDVDDKTGKASNIKDVAKAIKSDFPELFKPKAAGSADAGSGRATGAAADTGGMNSFLRRAAGKRT